MELLAYPAKLEPDPDGGFVVTFPDFGFGVTEGDSEEEALGRAADLLETLIAAVIDDNEDLPAPSAAGESSIIALRPLVAAKAGLYRALREAGVSKNELCRRLGLQYVQLQRILDPAYGGTKIDEVDRALRALGKSLVIGVADAA